MTSDVAARATLRQLWLTVLDRPAADGIADGDGFYSLGGTSLQVIALHTLLEERLGVGADIVELFDRLATQTFADWADGIPEPETP